MIAYFRFQQFGISFEILLKGSVQSQTVNKKQNDIAMFIELFTILIVGYVCTKV